MGKNRSSGKSRNNGEEITLIILQIRSPKGNYISGIFEEHADARVFMDQIPPSLQQYQYITRTEHEFPFFIIETKDGDFEFLTREEIIKKLRETKITTQDEDYVYFNVYRIDDEYRPGTPGQDSMGILNHHHIMNYHLENLESTKEQLLK